MHRYNFLRIARMTAPADTAPEGGTPPETGGGAGAPPVDPPANENEDPPGSDALGDAGKKALDAMKAERKAANERAAAAEAAAAALQAKLDGKEAEHAAEQEKQRVQQEALAGANLKIVKSEVKVAAKGVLADPQDAFRYPEFLDISTVEVDDDGNVDEAVIASALKALIEAKPYLAAQSGQRFQGGADGGARNGSAKSIDEQIAEASKAGNHVLAISLKRQKASANKS